MGEVESFQERDVEYEVVTKREGPAFNISITKECAIINMPCMQDDTDKKGAKKIFDADFTLALQCPKFPRDGKCKYDR